MAVNGKPDDKESDKGIEDENPPPPPGEEEEPLLDYEAPIPSPVPPPAIPKPFVLLIDATSSVNNCYFCSDSFGGEVDAVKKHIKEKHLDLCFECLKCEDKSIAALDLNNARKHLREEHSTIQQGEKTSLRFPSDHRHIKCVKCDQIFMGAEAANAAKRHLKAIHLVEDVESGIAERLIMSCRFCSAKFCDTSKFEAHLLNCFTTEDKM